MTFAAFSLRSFAVAATFATVAASASALTLPTESLQANSVQAFSEKALKQNKLLGIEVTPLGNATATATSAPDIDTLMQQINQTGFGLTFGLHTRMDQRAAHIAHLARAGNVYINRGMTGAVVGVQPFGGSGWSGTGPKAGGPHYVLRFITEQVISVNTTAAGGNAALLTDGSG